MKGSLTQFLLVSSLFLSSLALAQEPDASRYFDERAKGDAAASGARAEFALSVGNAALTVFCPMKHWKTPTDASSFIQRQQSCGSPLTVVANRFISKYGVGLDSANQDTLPVITHIFKVLKEMEDHQKSGKKGLSPSVQKRVAFIARNLGWTNAEVEKKLQTFISEKLQKKLNRIEIDFWGYFQQSYPERAQFNDHEQGSGLRLAFRWCSEKKKFVNEANRMVSDVLAAAINPENPDLGMTSSKQYEKSCELLPVNEF